MIRASVLHRARQPLLAGLAAVFLATGLAACSHHSPNAPAVVSTPPLDTPVHVLQAFKYAYENRDLALFSRLFSEDFVFAFAETDSAGSGFRNRPWMLEDELLSATHLFAGGGPEPPADRISLDFTNVLTDFPSSRPGDDPKWHREIRAEVNLRITRGQSLLEVRGAGLFFFVRGDSAAIPADLAAQGERPDSTRWWIDRWEDETASSAAPAARVHPTGVDNPNPTQTLTWGAIKASYL